MAGGCEANLGVKARTLALRDLVHTSVKNIEHSELAFHSH